jgi:hypothetical protein
LLPNEIEEVALNASLHHLQLVPRCDAAKTERRNDFQERFAAGTKNFIQTDLSSLFANNF